MNVTESNILTESQIRAQVRSWLRTAVTKEKIIISRKLKEAKESKPKKLSKEDITTLKTQLAAIASSASTAIDKLDVEKPDHLDESFFVTAFGLVVSAAGITKLLGYIVKGTAKILKSLGMNIDPEKASKIFFDASHAIHHFYLGMLEKLAAKIGVPEDKQKLVATVIFGLILGVALLLTGIGLYEALSTAKVAATFGEGFLAGIKTAESFEVGTDLFMLAKAALQIVPEVAGVIMDVAETAEEATELLANVA